MSVSNLHPEYSDHLEEWQLARRAYKGPIAIKKAGETYLPKPSGFLAQSDNGVAAYNAYKMRAQFPEIFAPTVRGITGTIHGADWEIILPSGLEYLRERATEDGQTLDVFSRRITSEVLISGRYGVLADVFRDGGEPYLAGYRAETIINWDENSEMFVLDESDYVRDGFLWVYKNLWRALTIEEGRYVQRLHESSTSGGEEIQPSMRGGGSLTEIPFVVIGSKDLTPEIEEPPLIGVARAALAYYLLDADYRHQLFHSGQETLFIINGEAPEYVGAGVVHELSSSSEVTPDAKYVGPSGKTIEAHKQARMDELDRAADSGAKLFTQDGGANESGDARRMRLNSEAANIRTIADTSAAGLEKILKHAARIAGANEDEVEVIPPKQLMEPVMQPQEALQLVQAWQAGGFSYETLHGNLQRGQIIPMERDAEAEAALLDVDEFREDPAAEV